MSIENNKWQDSFSVRMQNLDNQSKEKRNASIEDFEWKEIYSVDILSIDEQHKQLILLINNLHDSMRENRVDTHALQDLIVQLIHYTRYHFSYEEMLFHQHKYIGGEAHKKKHQQFIEQIQGFKENINEDLAVELSKFLKNWLIDHIVATDKKYTKIFKAHGVT